MKLGLFVASLIISVPTFSQPDPQLDSLKKYSYLLIGTSFQPKTLTDTPSLENLNIESFATGFFVRKGGKLYLGTAYHVMTTFDVYKGVKTDSKVDFWLVRYYDTSNVLKCHRIDIREAKRTSETIHFLIYPDICFVDVTGFFNDAKLQILDAHFYGKSKRSAKNLNERLISFGFPNWGQRNFITPVEYCQRAVASRYEGYIADSMHYDPVYKSLNIDSMYITTTPVCYGGTSGAPVFKLFTSGKRQWVEFAGVQSGKNEIYNCGYIVKKEVVEKILATVK